MRELAKASANIDYSLSCKEPSSFNRCLSSACLVSVNTILFSIENGFGWYICVVSDNKEAKEKFSEISEVKEAKCQSFNPFITYAQMLFISC